MSKVPGRRASAEPAGGSSTSSPAVSTLPGAHQAQGSLAERVVALHEANPDWGATVIADKLGCVDAYVRTVARRRGLSLPRSPWGAVPSYGAKWVADRRARIVGGSNV